MKGSIEYHEGYGWKPSLDVDGVRVYTGEYRASLAEAEQHLEREVAARLSGDDLEPFRA